MTERYVVEPGINPKNRRKCFFVMDSQNPKSRLPGVGTPISTKVEADYLAWVLNSQGSQKETEADGS